MNIYIAGRVSWGEGDVANLADQLEARGHIITLKWWNKKVKKPFLNNVDHSQVLSDEMVNAVKKSDVLILFAEDTILGAATEFGIAIGDDTKKREIILIHPPETRQSVFYTHPSVIVLENVDAIKKRPWY
ncbi:hypothetical protein HY004_02680 [Candidatus Saccharibacteria bacterium]|nr:hypothetical protein [Candidatus Saccharibacteria bacterium]